MEQESPPATTYQATSGRYRATGDARERFEELAVRDVSARAFMALVARGITIRGSTATAVGPIH